MSVNKYINGKLLQLSGNADTRLTTDDITSILGYTPASSDGSNATGEWDIDITGKADTIKTVQLANDADLDTLTDTSFTLYYASHGNAINNNPEAPYGFLLRVHRISGADIAQELVSQTGNTYIRSYNNNNSKWRAFKQVAYTTDNVASATKLQTARKINGVPFDGSADITIKETDTSNTGRLKCSSTGWYRLAYKTNSASYIGTLNLSLENYVQEHYVILLMQYGGTFKFAQLHGGGHVGRIEKLRILYSQESPYGNDIYIDFYCRYSAGCTLKAKFTNQISGSPFIMGENLVEYTEESEIPDGYVSKEFELSMNYPIQTDAVKTKSLNIYADDFGGTILNSTNATASNITVNLPSMSGTLALTTDNVASATSADKLNKDAGSATQPVYFKNGIPVAATYTLGKSVPSDAVFTDTTYSNFVKSGSGAKAGLVPAPSTTAGTTKYLREDGTWVVPPNTTYSAMTAATSSAAGKAGLVPAPAAGKQASFLRGDGTWAVPTDTKYTHPTTAGNKHIPAGGSSGQMLKWSAAGTAVWADNPAENALKADLQEYVVAANSSGGYGDFNTYLEPGIYVFPKSADVQKTTNAPSSQAGTLVVTDYTGNSKSMSETYAYRVQIFYTHDNSGVYRRNINTGATTETIRGNWIKDATSTELANKYDANASRTANTVLAAPNGSNGKATFRNLVDADLPTFTRYNNNSNAFQLNAVGWYRIAKYKHNDANVVKGSYGNSCKIHIKRLYANDNNEFHEIQLLSVYGSSYIYQNKSRVNTKLITKARHVYDSANKVAYIEIYYDASRANAVHVIVENGMDQLAYWEVTCEKTSETVSGVTVYSSCDMLSGSYGRASYDHSGNKIDDTYLKKNGNDNLYMGGISILGYENKSQTVYQSASETETASSAISLGNNSTMYYLTTIIRGYRVFLNPYYTLSASTNIATASDEKVKTFSDDIQTDEEKLVKLFDIIKPKSYSYNYSHLDNLNIGFSAQDIEKAMIELDIDPEKYGILNVSYNHMLSRGDGLEDSKFYTKFYEVSYNDLFSLSLLKMNVMEKQHVARLESLEERLTALENK